jgi:16S rRNA (cytidine1402-2'-O)-methyltransferase
MDRAANSVQNSPMEHKRTFRIGEASFNAKPLEPALYLVATPIGNLGDMTIRALETLAGVDLVACEDTRTSRVLLDRYGITTKPVSYHVHNEASSGARLLDDIASGKAVALISDAGTPLVSDPGGRIAADARLRGIKVVPIPGASAVLAALSIAGLPSERFLFEGFLPAKQTQRRSRLASLGSLDVTLLFYEAPHRLSETLADMASVYGPDRLAAVCRELTKTFEECVQGPLGELSARYPEDANVRGEIVIVVAPPAETITTEADVDSLLRSLIAEMPASKAAAEASRLTGEPKADLYKRILSMKSQTDG